ncbi:unnamed protein product, partial [Polarella glacialis]
QEAHSLPPPMAPGAQAGRQVLLEAFSFANSLDYGLSDSPERSGRSGRTSRSDEMKFVVKNTFIDVDEREDDSTRHSYTCQARFSNPNPNGLFPPTPQGQRILSTPGGMAGGIPVTVVHPSSPKKAPASPLGVGTAPSAGSVLHGKMGLDD